MTFTNDGIGQISDNVPVFKTNISPFDRAMLSKMRREGEILYKYPVPASSFPQQTKMVPAGERMKAANRKQKSVIVALKKQFRNQVNQAKNEAKNKIEAGMDPGQVKAELRTKLSYAHADASQKVGVAKRTMRALKSDIRKAVVQSSMAMAQKLRDLKRKEIQNLELRKRQVQELINSGKMEHDSGAVILNDINKKIAMKMRQIENTKALHQIKMIKALQKMGKISPSTAHKLIIMKKKVMAPKKKIKKGPVPSFKPVDAETGRVVSPQDLDKQIEYRLKHGRRATKLRYIRKNLGRPNAKNTKTVKIKLVPEARMSRPPTGEGIFVTPEGQRIPMKSTGLLVPDRPIPAEEIPSGKFITRGKAMNKSEINRMAQKSKLLRKRWRILYNALEKKGLTKGVEFTMKTGNLMHLINEIREGRRTGQSLGDLKQKFEMLNTMYQNQINEMATLVKGGKK